MPSPQLTTSSIHAGTRLCAVLGQPVQHSLSPLLHNAAYHACGLQSAFVFLAFEVSPQGLAQALKGLRELQFVGAAVTMPHKQSVLALLDQVSPLAKRIGAVNTVQNCAGKLLGDNTDMHGVIEPLRKRIGLTQLKGCPVVLLGAGGAARAALVGLLEEGAQVCILNRSIEKARTLAEEFGVAFAGLDARDRVSQARVIINATSIGMLPSSTTSPIDAAWINPRHLVFDLVYTPLETQLLKDARAAGASSIAGHEMFLEQAARQFQLFTGQDAPRAVMQQVLLHALGA